MDFLAVYSTIFTILFSVRKQLYTLIEKHVFARWVQITCFYPLNKNYEKFAFWVLFMRFKDMNLWNTILRRVFGSQTLQKEVRLPHSLEKKIKPTLLRRKMPFSRSRVDWLFAFATWVKTAISRPKILCQLRKKVWYLSSIGPNILI